jgi:nicotinamide phosphoribosyltransferase
MFTNPILWTDGYKPSHWLQYPPQTTRIYSYMESRGGRFAEIIPFGMQYYLTEYLSKPITMVDIDEAEEFFAAYFNDPNIFNRAGFERIVKVHNGYWPARIKFVPEGLPVPTHNVIMTIESTDDELPWVTNYLETILSLIW